MRRLACLLAFVPQLAPQLAKAPAGSSSDPAQALLQHGLWLAHVTTSAPPPPVELRLQRGGRGWSAWSPAACSPGLHLEELAAWAPLFVEPAPVAHAEARASAAESRTLPAWLARVRPRLLAEAPAIALRRAADGRLEGSAVLRAGREPVLVTRTSIGCALRVETPLPLRVGTADVTLRLSWRANDAVDVGRYTLVLWQDDEVLARLPIAPPAIARDAVAEPPALDFAAGPLASAVVRGRSEPVLVELVAHPGCVDVDCTPTEDGGWIVLAAERGNAGAFHACGTVELAFTTAASLVRGELALPVRHAPVPAAPEELSATLHEGEAFLVLEREGERRLAYPERMHAYREVWAAAGWGEAGAGRAPRRPGAWKSRVALTDGEAVEVSAEVVPGPPRPRHE